mmetsp:Transcript_37872/g.63693  ORF Transcript_37872/g.63693 Transcript_37872/m.63693 type:complete len:227 (-) Transcript_37872:1173-1853(-)
MRADGVGRLEPDRRRRIQNGHRLGAAHLGVQPAHGLHARVQDGGARVREDRGVVGELQIGELEGHGQHAGVVHLRIHVHMPLRVQPATHAPSTVAVREGPIKGLGEEICRERRAMRCLRGDDRVGVEPVLARTELPLVVERIHPQLFCLRVEEPQQWARVVTAGVRVLQPGLRIERPCGCERREVLVAAPLKNAEVILRHEPLRRKLDLVEVPPHVQILQHLVSCV